MGDYFIRYIPLPCHVEGVTVPNDDGTYSIYINSTLPVCVQQTALRHEVNHIRMNHLYSVDDITTIESEATEKASSMGDLFRL